LFRGLFYFTSVRKRIRIFLGYFKEKMA